MNIKLDNSNSDVVCYDTTYMCHATDSQIIKINNNVITNDKLDNIINIIGNLLNLNNNEKLLYKLMNIMLNKHFYVIKHDLLVKAVEIDNKNKITYERALDSLKLKNIINISSSGLINLCENYNLYNYLKNRNIDCIKYITIKL